jgi:glycosyltransferase involved in cell wall biosynthesis
VTPEVGYPAIEDPSGTAPEITVIVPTYRRPRSLALALAGLESQLDPGATWEVVVIDNEPAPGSEHIVVQAAESFPVPLRYLREPQLGASPARNRGIAAARGAVCAMLDDDVVPEHGWLAAVVEPLLAGYGDGVGGLVALDPAVPRPSWLDEAGVGGYLTRFTPSAEKRPLQEGEVVVTANAAFRTGLLREIGGFDLAFGPRGSLHLVCDDDALSHKFAAAGGRIWYAPAALVVHELPPERLRRRYLLRRAWLHGRSEWLLNRRSLQRGRLNGTRPAVIRFVAEARRRRAEGLRDPAVLFHLLCDGVRAVASIREGASWWFDGPGLRNRRFRHLGSNG